MILATLWKGKLECFELVEERVELLVMLSIEFKAMTNDHFGQLLRQRCMNQPDVVIIRNINAIGQRLVGNGREIHWKR